MLETILQSFSFIPHTASEELIFLIFFHKFCRLVAMGTDLKRLQQKGMFRRGLFKEHFCKRFVKISAMR